MGKQAQMKRSGKATSFFDPISRSATPDRSSAPLWRKDLLVSWLFRTCIRLQTSLDRRFLRFGMTAQEASVLLRCVEARKVTPGQLAAALGRDPGKITRFIDRLEASLLLTRNIDRRNRRFSIIKPTAKGKRAALEVASVFDNIRKELFAGILESDLRGLSQMLAQLHKNAVRIGSMPKRGPVRGRKRTGSGRIKSQVTEMDQLEVSPGEPQAFENEHTGGTVLPRP
jgi:DNA-binding MarR family transcriptional regulator